jgi:hypothetical protein
MKMPRIVLKGCLYCIALIVFIWFLWSGIKGAKQKTILEQRIADVQALTRAFHESPDATNIKDLTDILAHEGVNLNNPIPKDRTKPCYNLLRNIRAAGDLVGQSYHLIEETNVTDTNQIVVSCFDGSTLVLRREIQ